MVLEGGLEPPRVAPHAPQTCVSANSTTRAPDSVILVVDDGAPYASRKRLASFLFSPVLVPLLLPRLQQHADTPEHAAFADGDAVAHAFGGSGLDVAFGGRGEEVRPDELLVAAGGARAGGAQLQRPFPGGGRIEDRGRHTEHVVGVGRIGVAHVFVPVGDAVAVEVVGGGGGGGEFRGGLGADLNNLLRVTIGFDYGLLNLYKGDNENTKYNRYNFRVGVGYLF